jgi:hypothetical protein
MKIHTVFLRNGCMLPSGVDLRQEPFSDGWAEAVGGLASELDASIRNRGWHFMWMTDSYSARGLGRTPETAIQRALVRALRAVDWRFNGAELDSFQITNCLGFQIAKVTFLARHIHMQISLDSVAERPLQEVPAL